MRAEQSSGQVQENCYDAEGLRHKVGENGRLPHIGRSRENHSSDVSDIEKAMLDFQKEQEDSGNWKRKEDQTDQNAQSSCRGGKK